MYQLHPGSGSSHRILASLVTKVAKGPVLDVGAAEGFLGRLLAGSGLAVDAIEPNEAYATSAARYYRRLYRSTAEGVSLEDWYETIVLGDVLEHLVDPLAILRRLLEHLAPNGTVLVSVPNVAHAAVRLMLLAGRFPAMDRGPLDRTHLHFFTRSTAEDLLRQSGLEVLERHATVVPLEDVVSPRLRFAARLVHPGQTIAIRLAPSLFAYQWVFKARPV